MSRSVFEIENSAGLVEPQAAMCTARYMVARYMAIRIEFSS